MLDEVEDMDEESDAIQDWLDSHKRKSDREAMVTNRLGVSRGIKFELEKSWENLCRHLAAGGIKGKRQDINLLCLGDQKYFFCAAHQALQSLQKMSMHIHCSVLRSRTVSKPSWLQTKKFNLEEFEESLESADGHKPAGRHRSQFHNKNQKDVVALIPSKVSPDNFVYSGDTSKVDVARVQLFFKLTICPYKQAEESRNALLFVPAVCAVTNNGLVTQAAQPHIDMLDLLWHQKGYTLLYETTKPIRPHFDVV
eukprot:3352789-Rhodomonas_salina.2